MLALLAILGMTSLAVYRKMNGVAPSEIREANDGKKGEATTPTAAKPLISP